MKSTHALLLSRGLEDSLYQFIVLVFVERFIVVFCSALVGSFCDGIKVLDLQSEVIECAHCPSKNAVRAVAWYPADTGIFFSAESTEMIVWDTNEAKPVSTASFDGVVLDVAPQIVASKPIVAGLS